MNTWFSALGAAAVDEICSFESSPFLMNFLCVSACNSPENSIVLAANFIVVIPGSRVPYAKTQIVTLSCGSLHLIFFLSCLEHFGTSILFLFFFDTSDQLY
jgi:hypothetical protein